MSLIIWKYIMENKVASLIFVIVGLCIVVGTVVFSFACSISNRRKRHKCVNDDECTRSTHCCKDCEKIEKEF